MRQDLNLAMFRTHDIRASSGDLTPELALRLARAEARYFRETLSVDAVILAHDARLSGPRYLGIAADVYQQAGMDVLWIPGACSMSHLYFTAMQHPECAAVMFGASHSPGGDTGRIILGPGVRPIAERIGPGGGLDRLKGFYLEDAGVTATRRGRLIGVDNLAAYVEYSMELAGVGPGSLKGIPVLHDYLHGSGGQEMIFAFEKAGANLTPLHYTPDGRFPLGDPNPVMPDVTREGRIAIETGDYLTAAIFDGDADRIDIYSGKGGYLASSFVYAAILPYILDRNPGHPAGVFADLKSNPLAVTEMARAGTTVEVIRNGHSQIKNEMYEHPHVLGAVEESAHFYESFMLEGRGPYCTENTLYVALLVARAWSENPARFKDLIRVQSSTSREREWGQTFQSEDARSDALFHVEEYLTTEGLRPMTATRSGLKLGATLLRRGLPFVITQKTVLQPNWLQVCQRVIPSEPRMARWEVVGATQEITARARAEILKITHQMGALDPR
ncbi:MAG TPA: phosphoglucomutase [Armatimonadota bacterium]|nr:phosphoglucomutase [Armatimonadota bacterium]